MITNAQIQDLEIEACRANKHGVATLCRIALGQSSDPTDDEDAAREECERVYLTAQLTDLLRDGDPASLWDGEQIAELVDALSFVGAGVYEPRGIGDSDLSTEVLTEIVSFRLPFEFAGRLWRYLDDR